MSADHGSAWPEAEQAAPLFVAGVVGVVGLVASASLAFGIHGQGGGALFGALAAVVVFIVAPAAFLISGGSDALTDGILSTFGDAGEPELVEWSQPTRWIREPETGDWVETNRPRPPSSGVDGFLAPIGPLVSPYKPLSWLPEAGDLAAEYDPAAFDDLTPESLLEVWADLGPAAGEGGER